MNKRSAILMALGLTAALVVGGIAFASGIGGPAPSDAATASAGRADPIVRTKTRTVTVHRTAKPNDGRVVFLGGSGSAGISGSGVGQGESSGEATHESEGSDDAFEVDEHEGEDTTGTQDGSGSQDGGSTDSHGSDD